MVTTVGNLSAKGVSFYSDETMTQEIPQSAILDVGKSGEIEFYIGIRHRLDSVGRMGRILSLEENHKAYFIDMVQEVDGELFRNYDNIEIFNVQTEFDSYGFIKNLLVEMMESEFYEVLNFISTPHMGRGNARKIFERCVKEPRRVEFTDCKSASEDDPIYKIPAPVGFWEAGEWPPEKYYCFLTDFFSDPRERERESIWSQFSTNKIIRNAYTNKFINKGFIGRVNNYNYLNNIRPEQTELLNYRWRNGGYDVTMDEFRTKRKDIYNKFKSWYGGASLGDTSIFTFEADERTVRGFTGIGKVETRRNFERDEHVLVSLLGPRECVARDTNGVCKMSGYGGNWDIPEDAKQELLFKINNPEGTIPLDKDMDNLFSVIYANYFEGLTDTQVQSVASYEAIKMKGPNSIESIYAIMNNFGKIGGQTIYDNATGTEYRYFIPFKMFLNEQGWTLDEFMGLFSEFINARRAELEGSIETSNERIRIKDYSEFYDKERKAPFDGIYHYVPIPIMTTDQSVKIEKKIIVVDQDGNETISNSSSEEMGCGDFKLPINKDEFVSKVTVDGISVLISTFMRTKVNIKFKDEFPNLDKVKIRMFTSDFTYMNEREFKVR